MELRRKLGAQGRRYVIDARAGVVGTVAFALVSLATRALLKLPLWFFPAAAVAVLAGVVAFAGPQRRRQRSLAAILEDPSSSGSAFKLVDFIGKSMSLSRSVPNLLDDIDMVLSLRRYPATFLARPFMALLGQDNADERTRQKMVRWAAAMQRERGFVRERVVEKVDQFLRTSLLTSDVVVLYGYSSTVCQGIIRRACPDLVILVVEDTQYGTASVREHEIVMETLAREGIRCFAVPFSEVEHLLDRNVSSVATLDRKRLSLSPSRSVVAFLGCDALSLSGAALIPSVTAGVPSDSACLAEEFISAASEPQRRVTRRLIIVGESYKIATDQEIADTRSAAPLRPPWWLQSLHVLGLAVPFRAAPVNLYRIEHGHVGIITDAGIYEPAAGGVYNLEDSQSFWFQRLGERDLAPDRKQAMPSPGLNPGKRSVAVRGVIFDWNGVLALDEPIHFAAFARVALETCGHTLSFDEYTRTCLGVTDQEGVRALLAAKLVSGDAADLEDRKRAVYRELVRREASVIAPGAVDMLHELAQSGTGYRIVTASTMEEFALIRERAGLSHLLADDLVDADVPSGERYLAMSKALRALGCPPDTVLAVDDNEDNILIGQRLGTITVRVDSDPAHVATDADFCIKAISELPDFAVFAGSGRAAGPPG